MRPGRHFAGVFSNEDSSNHHPSDSAASSSSSGSGSPRSSSAGSSSLAPATIIDIFGHPLPDDNALARLPETFASSSSSDGSSSSPNAPNAAPRTSLVVEDYGFSTEDDEPGETARILKRNESMSSDATYSSRLSSRAPSPTPTSPGFWGATISRKPSRANLAEKAMDEKDLAVPHSDYFTSHHYRTSPLARKLGLPPGDEPVSTAEAKRKKGWFARRSRRKASLLLPANPRAVTVPSKHSTPPGRLRRCWRGLPDLGLTDLLCRFVRHPLVPARPHTILFALVLVASFATTLATFLISVLDVDKEPLPWRSYCQDQRAFPHAYADSLDPVNVFVGVFSTDSAYERRHLIRSTYARHSRPVDPSTGRPANNVQVKFILGKPKASHARRVALEMEAFNDVVVLDIAENMNRGKTHAFFSWANENATVPVYYRPAATPPAGPVTVGLGFQKADFVVKADDDSFIVLSELERHLRVAPREKTYWGYLIRNLFMGGECYALSSDLVDYVASSETILGHLTGAEDKKVAKWLRLHPEAPSINWVTERCWIYDHPKAGTTYAHGFLFPDEVERVRAEGRKGLSVETVEARGGAFAQAFSTVTKWRTRYSAPTKGMTMEEEVEALVEGGGRYSDAWVERVRDQDLVAWSEVVFEVGDERLRKSVLAKQRQDAHAAANRAKLIEAGIDSDPSPPPPQPPVEKADADPPTLRWGRPPADLLADLLVDDMAESGLKHRLLHARSPSSSYPGGEPAYSASSGEATTSAPPGRFAPTASSSSEEDEAEPVDVLIPAPSLRYDPEALAIRQRRFLGLPYGGTVVVHYLKRNEWFLETALILLGRSRTWDGGSVPTAYDPALVPGPSDPSSTPSTDLVSNGPPAHVEVELSNRPQLPSSSSSFSVDGEDVRQVDGTLFGGARMYGSPIVDGDGSIREGRPIYKIVPAPVRSSPSSEEEDEPGNGWVRGSPRLRLGDPEDGPRVPGMPAAEKDAAPAHPTKPSDQAPLMAPTPSSASSPSSSHSSAPPSSSSPPSSSASSRSSTTSSSSSAGSTA